MGRSFLVKSFAVVGMLILTSCLNGGGGNGGDCDKSFETAVDPDQIQGSSRILVSMGKLDFLNDPHGYVIEDIDLRVDLDGKHKIDEDVTLSMNGVKMSRQDGKGACDSMSEHADKNASEGHYKLQKFSLNGGLSFDLFLLQLKLNKGLLELGLNGKDTHIRGAQVVFKGKRQTCPTPSPSPTPTPTPQPKPAATTSITGVTPSGSPTASTNISIAFSADQTGVTFWCSLDGAAKTICTSPQSYASLGNGPHVFKVLSQNSSGVYETPGAEYDWTVDSVAPTVTITNAAQLPTLTNQTAISFAFASSKPGTFKCSLDGAAYATCASPKVYSGLAEGQHNFAVQAIDTVGNVSGAAAAFNWTIDVTAPITSIVSVSPFEAISNVDHRGFEFAANETSTFQCSIDNGAAQACVSPVNLTALSEGNHWFEVTATDVAGNVGAPVSVAWKSDYTAPVVAVGTLAPAPGVTNAKQISVEFSMNEPGSIYCSQDGAAAAPCVSPLVWAGVSEGVHQLQIYAVDLAGNSSAATNLQWTVDFTAPVLSFANIVPSAASYVNSPNLQFSMNSSKAANLSMTLNGSSLAASNPLTLNGLADGAYTLSIVATDAAGNVSAPLVHDFVIDTVAPTLTVTPSDVTDPTNLDLRSFTFAASEVVSYACNVDNQGFSVCQTPLNLSGLADGPHHLSVMATDLAGNASASVDYQWTVDTIAPVTTLAASQVGNAINFQFSADETATFQCALDGASPNSCSSPLSLTGVTLGKHTFTVWATDSAGNRDLAGATFAFEVLPPIATTITAYSPANSPSNQTSAQFTFNANQAATGFLCSLDGATAVGCASPVGFSGLSDGAHTFTVKAVDQWGVVESIGATHTWSVDTQAPVTTLSADQHNSSVTFTFSAGEAATFECSLDGAAVSACSSPLSLTGVAQGNHTFTVWSTDAAGNRSVSGASLAFTVYPPIATSITSYSPATSLSTQTTAQFLFSANQPTSGYLCSLDGQAPSACTSPASYSGLADGAHTFTVKAIDQWGVADVTGATRTWSVDTTPPTVLNLSTSATTNTITVTWSTSEGATDEVRYGVGFTVNQSSGESAVYTTAHSIKLTGLSSNTTYTVQVYGRDQAGNAYLSATRTVKTSR